MSCFVRIQTQTSIREFELHIGEPLPNLTAEEKDNCVLLQAYGDELATISRGVDGVPFVQRSVITWYGDDARFIFRNVFVT